MSDIEHARWIWVTVDSIVRAFRIRRRWLLRQATSVILLRDTALVWPLSRFRTHTAIQVVRVCVHWRLLIWLTSRRFRYDKILFVKCGPPLAVPADQDAADDAHTDNSESHATGDDEALAMG